MDLRLAKARVFLAWEARMVADLIRNTPDETHTTTTNEQQPAFSAEPMTGCAHPADDEVIEEGENREDPEQIGETVITNLEDLSLGEIVVACTSQDSVNFREGETMEEPTLPSEPRSTMQHHEVATALKVSNFLSLNELLVGILSSLNFGAN